MTFEAVCGPRVVMKRCATVDAENRADVTLYKSGIKLTDAVVYSCGY
jgi:hypothetical protein